MFWWRMLHITKPNHGLIDPDDNFKQVSSLCLLFVNVVRKSSFA